MNPVWSSRWIWAGTGTVTSADPLAMSELARSAHDSYCLFRGTYVVSGPVRSAWLRAAGDSRFKLYINGIRVARGPLRSPPDRMPSELIEVAEHLHEGTNVIAALVRFYGTATSSWIPAPMTIGLGGGAFGAELELNGDIALATDGTWKATQSPAWRPAPAHTALSGFLPEDHDARLLQPDWTSPTFDDSDWPNAIVLDAGNLGSRDQQVMQTIPYGQLLSRAIPQLDGSRKTPLSCVVHRTDERSTAQLSVPSTALPAGRHLVSLDFGETVAGEVCLAFDGPAGAVLDLAFGEEVLEDGTLALPFAHHRLRYTARAGPQRFESFEPVGGRYAAVSVDASEPSSLSLSVRERLFPIGTTASFRCSDPVLEQIYEVGLRTVALCSHDSYIDCPTREQRAWVGDAVVHQSVHLATGTDWSLARWHPDMTDSPRPDGMLPMTVVSNLGGLPGSSAFIPDWALHWIHGLRNLMDYTGDRELIARHLPTCERVLRWFVPFQQADGLLQHVLGAVLIDWSNLPLDDTSAALNALWARGLLDFEVMSRWLGDAGRGDWAASRRAEVADAFDVFWDETRGGYRDQRLNGVIGPKMSRHANAAAITAGLVPPARLMQVADLLVRRDHLVDDAPVPTALATGDMELNGTLLVRGNPEPTWDTTSKVLEAQPFFRYVVHDALAMTGRADAVVDLCRDWQVFLERGETTWPEAWAGGTHCHGWSATPTRDLIRYVLGVSPASPGFESVNIQPALGDLAWAEGHIPHPCGPLSVRVTARSVRVTSPVPVRISTSQGWITHPAGTHDVSR